MKKNMTIGSESLDLSTVLAALAVSEATLTKEERMKRKVRREKMEQLRILKTKILNNICPECDGKLMRGKKEKKYNYQRIWTCKECSKRFTSEGVCLKYDQNWNS